MVGTIRQPGWSYESNARFSEVIVPPPACAALVIRIDLVGGL